LSPDLSNIAKMPPKEVKSFSDNDLLMLALIKANVKGNIKWEGVVAAVGGGKTQRP
jgi:hypothetical protein